MTWRFTLNPSTDNLVVEEPTGWSDVVYNLARENKYGWHGVFFEFAIDLSFTDSGYRFIRDAYDAEGTQATIELLVELQSDQWGEFEEAFSGNLNLTNIDFDCGDSCSVKVGIEATSDLMTFKNRYDQAVELESLESFDGTVLPAYDNIGREITLPSKVIQKIYNATPTEVDYANSEGEIELIQGVSVPFDHDDNFALMPSGVVIGEITEVSTFGVVGYGDGSVTPLFTLDEGGTGTIDLSMQVNVDFKMASLTTTTVEIDSHTIEIHFKVRRGGVDIHDDLIATTTDTHIPAISIPTSQPAFSCEDEPLHSMFVVFTHNITFDFEAGDEVYLFAFCRTSGVGSNIGTNEPPFYYCTTLELEYEILGYFLDFTFASTTPATTARVSLINEVLSRTAEAITDDQLRIYSDYFGRTDAQPYVSDEDGCGSLEAVCNGLAVRGFPATDSTYRNSFKFHFDSLNPIHNIGLGIEPDPNRAGFNLLRVEPAEYFYSDEVVLVCDKIRKYKKKVDISRIFSLLKIGYDKWEAEEYTGLDEFNASREYRTTLNKIQNTLELLSKYIASGYALEITRRLPFAESSTKDWRYDNDTFIICVKRDGDELIAEQGNIISPANLIDPDSVINFRLSPARNALRWMKWLTQSYKDPTHIDSLLVFTNGTANYKAQGLLDDGCIAEATVLGEQQSIHIDTLDDPDYGKPILFPETHEYTHPMSLKEWKALKANPYGIIQTRWGQQTTFTDLHLKSIKYKPNQGESDFVLMPKGTFGGFVPNTNNNRELREDDTLELREDDSIELRE